MLEPKHSDIMAKVLATVPTILFIWIKEMRGGWKSINSVTVKYLHKKVNVEPHHHSQLISLGLNVGVHVKC